MTSVSDFVVHRDVPVLSYDTEYHGSFLWSRSLPMAPSRLLASSPTHTGHFGSILPAYPRLFLMLTHVAGSSDRVQLQ